MEKKEKQQNLQQKMQSQFQMKNCAKNLIVNCKSQNHPMPQLLKKIRQFQKDKILQTKQKSSENNQQEQIYTSVYCKTNENDIDNINKDENNKSQTKINNVQDQENILGDDFILKKPIRLKKQKSSDFYRNIQGENQLNQNNSNLNEYYEELYELMIKEEQKMVFSIQQQDQMFSFHQQSQKSRRILVNWMIYESEKLKFDQEVMFRSIQLVDLCLFKCKQQISDLNLQKLGVASLQLALKMEKQDSVLVDEFSKITKGGVSPEDIIVWESNILECINFQIFIPNILHFINWYGNMMNLNDKIINLAFYISENTLYSSVYLEQPSSLIASVCCFLANSLFNGQKQYPENFEVVTGYSKQEINEIKSIILLQVMKVREYSKKELKIENALFYKYSKEYYDEIYQNFQNLIDNLLN